jgi:hypothetical protein
MLSTPIVWNFRQEPNGSFSMWTDGNEQNLPIPAPNQEDLVRLMKGSGIGDELRESVLAQLLDRGAARIEVARMGTFSQIDPPA